MRDLIKQEQFELEVLDKLNSGKLLPRLVFGGGTMLRLCHGLNRYSVDLDFWIDKKIDKKKLFNGLKDLLSRSYKIKDAAYKFNTILFEIRSGSYPRSLKIEIRKKIKKVATEQVIAYSGHSNMQVVLRSVSLADMMKAKIEAFLNRKEIRDAFDMEFLVKKGIGLEAPKGDLERLLKNLDALTKNDYAVKLGSLLDESQRRYYVKENFKILRSKILEKLKKY